MASMVSSALLIAKQYGINERTVRDIWKQRSWAHVTSSLADGIAPVAKKKLGRPIGSKDIRPRKQRRADVAFISSDASASSPTVLKYKARLQSDVRLNSGCYEWPADQIQIRQGTAVPRRLFSFLHVTLESRNDPACGLQDKNKEEDLPSIDDELYTWTQCGRPWIINVMQPFDGEL